MTNSERAHECGAWFCSICDNTAAGESGRLRDGDPTALDRLVIHPDRYAGMLARLADR